MTYKLKHFKWIPHRLSEAQKQTRVATSERLLDLLGSVQYQGWKISCHPGRSLVLFLESTGTNLASRPGKPANSSTTNDQQSENNADSGVESTGYFLCRKDRSGPANTILITFFPKYTLFVMQEIVGN
jgi:hypothetical protein